MEIKDAISIYDFLGKLGYWGSCAMSVILISIISYLISNATEKITDNKKIRIKVVGIAAIIIFVCSIVIIIHAVQKQQEISYANAIKNYMVSKNWKWLGYRRIATEVNLSDDLPAIDTITKGVDTIKHIKGNISINDRIIVRAKKIEKWVSDFPDEFIKTTVSDEYSGDKFGVELIDTNAIRILDKYHNEMLPFYRAKILNYMESREMDSITYPAILNDIDNRLQNFLIDKLIAKYGSDFTPISIYDGYWNIDALKRVNK